MWVDPQSPLAYAALAKRRRFRRNRRRAGIVFALIALTVASAVLTAVCSPVGPPSPPVRPSAVPAASPRPPAASPSPSVSPVARRAVKSGPPLNQRPPASAAAIPAAGSCHSVDGLPDRSCTPGASNPEILSANQSATICSPAFSTQAIRDKYAPESYMSSIKPKLMAAYGVKGPPANYALDHLVALEVGGHPWSIDNLWVENRQFSSPGHLSTGLPGPYAEDKDIVENAMKQRVCGGFFELSDAQYAMATVWSALRPIAVASKTPIVPSDDPD